MIRILLSLLSVTVLAAFAAIFALKVLMVSRPALKAKSTQTPAAITQLTHETTGALHPVWSPDNRLIAFEANRDGHFHIYVMGADGSGQHALTDGTTDDRHPVWTPDGQSILFDSSDGSRQDIWSVHVPAGSRRQLTHVDGLAEFATLSPDAKQMAFFVFKDMTLNLWSANADGIGARPLTQALADARKREPTMAGHRPGWSPDSQWLAYTGGNGKSIWVMRRDGTEVREVISDGETNRFPWFLADGRLAYITEYVPPRYESTWTNLWALDLNTRQRSLLREKMSMQEPLAWSADNSRLVFASPRNGPFDLYLIDLNAPGGLPALQGNQGSEESHVR